MRKAGQGNQENRPFLTTNDVARLTGVSRRMIEGYVKEGICKPRRSGPAKNADMLWTYEQAALVGKVRTLLRGGMELKEISAVIQEGGAATMQRVYEQRVKDDRDARRDLKDSVHHLRKIEDTLELGRIDGLYLRYIPQQWLAIAPARDGHTVYPGTESYIELAADLHDVVQVVGWSSTMDFGSVASMNDDGTVGTSYATLSLASPAMPTVTGAMVIDGGCYHVIDPERAQPRCNGAECFECARFGRFPTDEERRRWNEIAAEHPGIWDRTVMVDDLQEPYPAGMWSGYTRQRIEAREHGGGRYVHGQENRRGRSMRPRLMPHEVRLPAGVTSCVIPAGIYLCKQCDEGGHANAQQLLVGVAISIAHQEFTVDEEVELFEQSLERQFPPQGMKSGPIMEPFAMPRSPGDPNMAGWRKVIEQSEIQKLFLPTKMALEPEDGFLIICNALPSPDPNAPLRYELELLVGCPEIDPPPRRTNVPTRAVGAVAG